MDNDQKKSSKFGLGLLLGTVLGGIAAFFLSPGSGKENREAVLKKINELKDQIEEMEIDKKVKEIWGEVTEDGRKMYKQTRKEVLMRLDDYQEKWEDFDKEKYVKMVGDVVNDVKSDVPKVTKHLLKLKESFVEDWENLSKKKTAKRIKSNSNTKQ